MFYGKLKCLCCVVELHKIKKRRKKQIRAETDTPVHSISSWFLPTHTYFFLYICLVVRPDDSHALLERCSTKPDLNTYSSFIIIIISYFFKSFLLLVFTTCSSASHEVDLILGTKSLEEISHFVMCLTVIKDFQMTFQSVPLFVFWLLNTRNVQFILDYTPGWGLRIMKINFCLISKYITCFVC